MFKTAWQKRAIGLEEKVDVLDLCSSWTLHLPEDARLGWIAGMGMERKELEANKTLMEHHVQDLNANPSLGALDDDLLDGVCNGILVDYLTNLNNVFKETHRVLCRGVKCLVSFSNRCFPKKVVAI